MAPRPLPPAEYLRECFLYDPKTGSFTWRHRPETHFDTARVAFLWNAKWAGKPAFTHVERNGGYLKSEVVFETSRYRMRASRVAWKLMTGSEPGEMIDHKNRKTADNRWRNLRAADGSMNQANTRKKKGKRLPKGVHAAGTVGRFCAKGYSETGRKLHLGTFGSVAEARAAYIAHSRARYGEYFRP